MKRGLAAALIAATLTGGGDMADAMGQGPQPLQVACVADGGKVALPSGLCALFVQRLEAAYPGQTIRIGAPADMVLVVARSDSRAFSARIDIGAQQGEERGTMRRGAPLDTPALARFLDTLIAQTPL